MNWLSNPHADFVVAAYVVAIVTLAGLYLVTRIGLARLRRRDPSNKS